MKRLFIHSTLLIILIGIPLIPSYLHLFYISIEVNQTTNIDYEDSQDLEVLKGDIAYLKAILSRAFENESKDNGDQTPLRTNNSISQLVFTVPSKIEVYTPQIINNKSLNFITKNLTSIYLKIPSPPPKIFS